MIFVGNSRGNGQNLAQHLMSSENEHVTLHEISGFASDDLYGALKEAEAISKGTRCKKYLYSLSLNPPSKERVETDMFLEAITKVEQKLGFEGQPRAIVFHEKEGRRHCHVVWSRIDTEEMKAINMVYPKRKLMDVSKDLFLEHGWEMPKGMMNPKFRDSKNFTLEQWQQAKRIGQDPREMKAIFQSCWKQSDDKRSFTNALKEHGLIIAKGDKRGYVATDINGEIYAIARWVGVKTKEVKARLGDNENLPSIEQAHSQLAKMVSPVLDRLKQQQTEKHNRLKKQQEGMLWKLADRHVKERKSLIARQEKRELKEIQARQERFNKGLRGLFDRITGAYSRTKNHNELETYQAAKRDQKQRDALIFKQTEERKQLALRSGKVLAKSIDKRTVLAADLELFQKQSWLRDGPKR
ncbi:MAG: hypothetical protein Pars2KO_32350 [Parasphingorhabdus sp.]